MLPVFIEAEYEDGYIHREDELDRSPYVPYALNKNIFNDILERRPEAIHGKMVRFSLFLIDLDQRHDIDFTMLPDNARPIHFRDMKRVDTFGGENVAPPTIVGIDFGYQYTDADGKNQQEVFRIE